ncbi:hypothetical protein [Paenibacillus rhizophilus]|uniref:Uncharacterized protein n=1 Tax=Paenibacillus rhizophilus TaxID=1850366 RepID=A0A3N9P4D6_9BACL|nr:hypothetical protein [Paenibacillus rhizophilus]RQW09934.1 hypothetical protein EH198_17795 [Paenibacillus rhizophilus]
MENAANNVKKLSAAEFLSLYDNKITRMKAEYEQLKHYARGRPIFVSNPKLEKYRKLKKLLEQAEPREVIIGYQRTCQGCGRMIGAQEKVLQVHSGIVCDRTCHGLQLEKQYGH